MECGSAKNLSHEASNVASTCRNVKDVDKLFSSVISLGKGIIGSTCTDLHALADFVFVVRCLFDHVSIHIILVLL